MANRKSNDESGQAIILIVLAIVVLMGFLALAIDVGSAYSSRRTVQNASDASALAGAKDVSQKIKGEDNLAWNCSTLISKNNGWVDAANEAITQATGNNYKINPTTGVIANLGGGKVSVKYGIDTKNGVEVICYPEGYVDVHVQLTTNAKTNIMQVVNNGTMVNTVDTIVRVKPQTIYGNGAAILALKKTCDHTQKNGGIFFDGTVEIKVTGGDIISNSCIDKNGASGDVSASPQNITYHTDVEPKKSPIPGMNPQPTYTGGVVTVDSDSLAKKATSGCSQVPNYGSPKDVTFPKKSNKLTINPGNYNNITVAPSEDLTLNPGLYCIYGTTTIKGTIYAADVTLFVPSDGGDFTIDAGATTTLTAPKTGCDYDTPGCSPAIGGLALLYMPDDADKKVLWITGNASSLFRGSIIAPNTIIDIGGNTKTDSMDAQIIGETIKTHGNGKLTVNYKKDMDYWLPALMNLQK